MRTAAFSLLFVTALLPAQEPTAEAFGHSRHGATFDEGPRQAAYWLAGMSSQVHLPVGELCQEAQAFFDQGVCQQHGFWFLEAERSFRQVAQLHPDCAMAYWGMAMANVESDARAAGFLANAVQRCAAVPRYEQLWIDAWASYYLIDDACRTELQSGDKERAQKAVQALVEKNGTREKDKLGRKLIKDLETLVFEFPADIEAKAFLAIQNWRNYDWGNGIPIVCHAGIDALLDQVFQKAPLHPAHHYRVHLWDREKGERALRSAAVLGDTAPGIAHQWHMAGHIYDKLHRHAEAAWQQEASARVDHAHMMRDRVMPFLIHNYGHNQEWLARSLSYVGCANEALAVAKNLAALPRHPKWNTLDDDQSIATDARSRLVSVCEDHELWDEAVRLVHDGVLDRTDSVRGEVARLGLLGRALFRLGRTEEAEAVVAEVAPLLLKARAERAVAVDKAEDEALAKKKARADVDKAMGDAGRDRTDVVRAVVDLQKELRGERLLAAGDAKGATAEFEAIEGFPKALLADAFVAAGEPQKAIDLLEKECKERPNRVPTLGRLLLAHDAAFAATAAPVHKERRRDEMLAITNLVGNHEQDFDASPLLRRASIGVDARPPAKSRVAFDTMGFGEDFGTRPPLDSLGPHHWRPSPAPAFDLPCTNGSRRSQGGQRGKPTLIVFYLGFGCLHCVQQLEALSPKAKDFAADGIDVLPIGNETLAKAQDNLAALGDKKFSFPLLADPDLAAFKAWRCFDDFEGTPLHGTFLVDGEGNVRWQDISFEPFTQFDWLLSESRRLLALSASAGSGTK